MTDHLTQSERLVDKATDLLEGVSDPQVVEAFDLMAAAVVSLANEVRRMRDADHRLIYQQGHEAVCTCGTHISVYGTTKSIAAAFAGHVGSSVMTAATLTPMDFLLARIAEDEALGQKWAKEGALASARKAVGRRMLAEGESKRHIIGMMCNVLDSFSAQNGGPGYPMWNDVNRRERHHANEVLYRLALPYADHPDYPEEWRP